MDISADLFYRNPQLFGLFSCPDACLMRKPAMIGLLTVCGVFFFFWGGMDGETVLSRFQTMALLVFACFCMKNTKILSTQSVCCKTAHALHGTVLAAAVKKPLIH